MFNNLILRLCCMWWSLRTRASFYRDLADAVTRKVGMRDFLERQASNARMLDDTTAVKVYRALSARLSSGFGASYAELLLGIAPRSDQLMLHAVDDAGSSKVQALLITADAVDFQINTITSIAKELIVPILAVPCVGFLCIITADIVTGIAKDSPPEIWTGYNGFVRWLSETINAYAIAIGVGLLAFVVGFILILPRWIGPLRSKAENLPGFGLYRDYNAALVLSSMAMMIRSGKTLRESLEAMRVPSRPWLRWHLSRIISSLEDNPTDYIGAFGKGLMPKTVKARMASLLDSSKNFADALVVLGSSEIKTLGDRVQLSALTTNWAATGALVLVAVLLSLGQMTISTALSRESEPSKVLQRQQNRQS
ncbi:hypothetical protein J2W32_006482 [Variovorax boronicumulans]|uniref:Type II secretion system protein GspF domain-containing protein n=1 Tax=Variovorax boronicumulans TaxID=436515 RepID=A0AAW8DC48_9BURK|nr:hypothetical protein [Variovorax boronicumulans]MDP9897361.1 hypothetical protein [Variovorax boronicumulans]MDQ0057405.1 hypothetical protein [Variovorax boronicumulans]